MKNNSEKTNQDMNNQKIDLATLLKLPFSRKARNKYRQHLMYDFKLIMTLLVRDEQDIIETQIRFHKAMGVDGFIVTSHNSIDKTNEILEKLKEEGLVLEIIYETDPAYKQDIFVDRMIRLAKNKYKARWVINADADEFFFSKELNLKKSLAKYYQTNINVLKVVPQIFFPDNSINFLECPYFMKKPLLKYEAEKLGIKENDEALGNAIASSYLYLPKVIHKTKGYKKIAMGNHDVKIRKRIAIETNEIVLYHYHIQNYEEQVKKLNRYVESINYLKEGLGFHIKSMIEKYQSGELKREYDIKYNEANRKFLINEGVISIDKSVSNFLTHLHGGVNSIIAWVLTKLKLTNKLICSPN